MVHHLLRMIFTDKRVLTLLKTHVTINAKHLNPYRIILLSTPPNPMERKFIVQVGGGGDRWGRGVSHLLLKVFSDDKELINRANIITRGLN